MTNFIDSPFIRDFTKITLQLYEHGWDERNGGNVSYRLTEGEVSQYEDVQKISRNIPIDFDGADLAGMYFLVTGTGKYFKNIIEFPNRDVGLVRIAEDGKSVDIVWGFNDGGKPTSEFPTHLMGHATRLKVNPNQRVIMHCHPTNLIAMTFTFPLDEKEITKTLWKMQTESIVVFPDGVGIVPWMVPGNTEIGKVTSDKLKEFSSVIWPQHGIFASGSSIDEAFGLIETIEKAAEIYNIIQATGGQIQQTITDQQLANLARAFGVKPKKGYLEV
ncbi:rhamnulose-1-phosphate aldolase [Caldifermentibacillus hisashii]|uniref:rhamnulose-1-phosphate aldolase n=1 Tax=Caldifermentibacillus hisashii TaxID=996558 RepID=UPI002E0BDF01|nr:rhamnulose-1-phosphate aldolase [Caldifermentibacillus hisashii]MEC5273653.1 rhamnulose-1-phosphate aldolase [Caldifermentibacillus hisashii]